MTIKNILVPFISSPACSAALSIAAKMARKYDAHLTGLFSADPARALRSGLTTYPELVEAVRAGHERLKVASAEAFGAQINSEAHDLKGQIHWVAIDREADSAIMEYARYVDITVIGAPARVAFDDADVHPDRVALSSGRPLLVVPETYRTEVLGEHAIVAWDGKRAAARALGDAMQILESKARVTVLTIGDEKPGAPTEGLDVVEHLRRHGLTVEMVHAPRMRNSVAETIIDYCKSSGAGILIMGAYEHSKFNEDLFGGVTHAVIRRLNIPTLMAH